MVQPPLKILHLSGGPATSGAGRGALWIHEALNALGHDSRIVFAADRLAGETRSRDWLTRLHGWSERAKHFLNRKATNLAHRAGSAIRVETPVFRRRTLRNAEEPRWADVIHVHWIGDFSFDLRECLSWGKPVVLTLRDMSGFTGGCAYDLGCGRYRTGCKPCPGLRPALSGWLAGKQLGRRNPGDAAPLRIVAISRWLADMANAGTSLGGHRVGVVPNAVDPAAFGPLADPGLRAQLGIAADRPIVVCGCLDVSSRYKNMGVIPELAERLASRNVAWVVFGGSDAAMRESLAGNPDVHFLGPIADDSRLREIYAAADAFVLPSIQEAFGKTVVEAALCKTPVVAFDRTGASETIRHCETGYLARNGDVADLAAGIAWVLGNNPGNALGRAARGLSLEHFTVDPVARTYLELYTELLGGTGRRDGVS